MPAKKEAVKREPDDFQEQLDQELETPALHNEQLRMSYRIARGEQGVLSFEPYKALLLPLWRFRTPAIARASSAALWARFVAYGEAGDFVGMDMARKFIQMGMTRAKRYANHQGGRKYAKLADGGRGEQLAKSQGHAGRDDKLEASEIFRKVWEECRAHEGYQRLKQDFLAEQKAWDKTHPRPDTSKLTGQAEPPVKSEEDASIKSEAE